MNKLDVLFFMVGLLILIIGLFSVPLSLFYSVYKEQQSEKPYTIICIEGVQHFQTDNETRPVVTASGRFRGCE